MFQSNKNIVFSCIYHVVWVTKYRKKYLGGDIEKRLKEICRDVSNECEFEIKEMECERDHIHLLVECNPQFGVHKAVKRMKDDRPDCLDRNLQYSDKGYIVILFKIDKIIEIKFNLNLIVDEIY